MAEKKASQDQNVEVCLLAQQVPELLITQHTNELGSSMTNGWLLIKLEILFPMSFKTLKKKDII